MSHPDTPDPQRRESPPADRPWEDAERGAPGLEGLDDLGDAPSGRDDRAGAGGDRPPAERPGRDDLDPRDDRDGRDADDHHAPPAGGHPHGSGGRSDDDLRAALAAVRDEVGKVVVGQGPAVAGLLVAMLARGHVLFEGVPGVAKTLLVRAFAAALSIDTRRVQFTPDLMPGDITGSLVYDGRDFTFRPGPVFTNVLLADEINRTPPKTQAALLEAMAERQVTVDGQAHPLPAPFLVAATQNPVEYEGTYPLPEAQLDRFLLKVTVGLPGRDEEVEVLRRHAAGFDPGDLPAAGVRGVCGPEQLLAASEAVARVEVSDAVAGYIVDIVRATRALPSVELGVSPRGATALLATSRAWAWLSGRDFVTPDDVQALAQATLAHRLTLRTEAELDGLDAATALDGALAAVRVPQ